MLLSVRISRDASPPANHVPPPRLVCVELNPGPQEIAYDTRVKIIGCVEDAGMGVSETARKYNVDRSAVKKIMKKWRERKLVGNLPGRGRKRKLTESQRRAVLKRGERKQDAPEITRAMNRKLEEPVSCRTIQRTLRGSSLKYLVEEEETKLTESQKQKRVKFANEAEYDWNFVLFSDEKTFELGGGKKKKSWVNPKKRVKREVESHPKKVYVWGGIGAYFKTPLVIFTGTMNAERYLSFIQKHLPPKIIAPDCPKERQDDWIFVQDNAKWHKAKEVMDYLEQEAPLFIRDFPPNSPDFNIIEDIWSTLDRMIGKYDIKSVKSMKRHLRLAWKKITWETVRKSVNSLPKRCELCVLKKGERFGY